MRIGKVRPGERESEHHAAHKADGLRFHDDAPVSQAQTCAKATAVPKNVIAPTILAVDPICTSPRPPPAMNHGHRSRSMSDSRTITHFNGQTGCPPFGKSFAQPARLPSI